MSGHNSIRKSSIKTNKFVKYRRRGTWLETLCHHHVILAEPEKQNTEDIFPATIWLSSRRTRRAVRSRRASSFCAPSSPYGGDTSLRPSHLCPHSTTCSRQRTLITQIPSVLLSNISLRLGDPRLQLLGQLTERGAFRIA
jgi:hypothetical protein